jgi:hypothetical protein
MLRFEEHQIPFNSKMYCSCRLFSIAPHLDRHTVLSPKAMHVRIHRIMKRLQDTAGTLSPNGNLPKPVESEGLEKAKNSSDSVSTFSLSTFPGDAAISKSRRQLSLDTSPTQSTPRQQ